MALEHGFHEIVVGDSLVDKAAPSGIHREQSRLGTVERKMREQPAAAVRPHGDRCRRPQAAAAVLVRRNPCPQPLADGDAVAGIPLMAERMHRHGLRHEGCAELLVVRVASGRQHHAFSRLDQDLLSANDNARAGDPVPIAQDVCNRGLEQDRHLLLLQAVEQPCDQRIAHHEPGAARISQPVEEKARYQLHRMDEIGERTETGRPGVECRPCPPSCHRTP